MRRTERPAWHAHMAISMPAAASARGAARRPSRTAAAAARTALGSVRASLVGVATRSIARGGRARRAGRLLRGALVRGVGAAKSVSWRSSAVRRAASPPSPPPSPPPSAHSATCSTLVAKSASSLSSCNLKQ